MGCGLANAAGDTPGAGLLEERESALRRVRTRMAGVGRTLAVMSGKGGVGKSAVAVHAACALARRGVRVGILDADLHGPSVAKMLGLRGQPVRVAAAEAELRPVRGPFGLAVQSMDFFLQGTQPLDWDGPEGEGSTLRSALEEAALADLLGSTQWGELDVLLVDLPPGADRLPAFKRLHPGLTGALVVTIPTEVALLAVERSIRRAHEARIPILGLVENMGSAVCARCGTQGPLFQEAPVDRLAQELDVEIVARIPFDPKLAADADAGRPFLDHAGLGSPAGRAFEALATRIESFAPDAAQQEGW